MCLVGRYTLLIFNFDDDDDKTQLFHAAKDKKCIWLETAVTTALKKYSEIYWEAAVIVLCAGLIENASGEGAAARHWRSDLQNSAQGAHHYKYQVTSIILSVGYIVSRLFKVTVFKDLSRLHRNKYKVHWFTWHMHFSVAQTSCLNPALSFFSLISPAVFWPECSKYIIVCVPLPLNCRNAPSVNTFKIRLKTFLFASA